MFFIHAPGFQSLRITPGFYPGVIKPVKSVLRPRFLLIIPGFYPGFAIGYYFQGLTRPKRLLLYSGLSFLVSFNAIALQFANWPSNRCGGGSRYPRPAFSLNSVTLQFINQFSLGWAALQFARLFSLGAALQFAGQFPPGSFFVKGEIRN